MELGLLIVIVLNVFVAILLVSIHQANKEESTENTLVFQSSVNGYLGALIINTILTGFLTFLLFLLASYFKHVYATYSTIFPSGNMYVNGIELGGLGLLLSLCSGVGIIGFLVLTPATLIAFFEGLRIIIFGPLETYKFCKTKDGRINFIDEKFGFLMNRSSSEIIFDKITDIEFYQSPINKKMGTGTMVLRISSCTLCIERHESIVLRGLEDLKAKKDEIEKFMGK